MQHRIVIQRHRPGLRAALIGGGAFLLLVSGFALYHYTRSTTVSDFERTKSELETLREERRSLSRELRQARAEIDELRDQVAFAERSSEIDTQACATVQASLAAIESEAADLREQVAFYRGIVSPEQARAGVRVLELRVSPGEQPGWLRYDLVLIQSVRHDRRIAGSVDLRFEGTRAGKPETLRLSELQAADQPAARFDFKYFQEFGGEFRLPAGFAPGRVRVTLSPSGQGAPEVEDEFEWARIQSDRRDPP
ncbi:MAG TPA: DUF6776 family protein [Nevskiaceae bacterium]|nr:DUF6776 family protein [Nevskiaceae bacterium]